MEDERDLKMSELYESVVEFYEAHGQQTLADKFQWALDVYAENDELKADIEELKEEIGDLEQYIEDHQVSDSEERLRSYYNSRF